MSNLAIGDSAIITFMVNVNIDNYGPGTFYNTAIGFGTAQNIGNTLDYSANGTNPDLNHDGKPDGVGEDSPTPIFLDELTSEAIIPHGFSPNGDGENDVFVLKAPFTAKVNLYVYNRWGDIVYGSDDYKNNWGGVANSYQDPDQKTKIATGGNSEVADGTYFYVVEYLHKEKKIKYASYLEIRR